jgi:serine/threonine protein phosphatase PrpC
VPPPELLVQAALAREASDNVTAVTVEVRGVG